MKSAKYFCEAVSLAISTGVLVLVYHLLQPQTKGFSPRQENSLRLGNVCMKIWNLLDIPSWLSGF